MGGTPTLNLIASYEMDLTEIDVSVDEDSDNDENHDIDDLVRLFADNEYFLKYHIQQLENFNKFVYTQENYNFGNKKLLN